MGSDIDECGMGGKVDEMGGFEFFRFATAMELVVFACVGSFFGACVRKVRKIICQLRILFMHSSLLLFHI